MYQMNGFVHKRIPNSWGSCVETARTENNITVRNLGEVRKKDDLKRGNEQGDERGKVGCQYV